MLVRLTDIKTGDVWINPLYVKAVIKKSKYTEVFINYGTAFSAKQSIRVDEAAEDVALKISAAMPDSPAWQGAAGAMVAADELAQQQAAAAAAAGLDG